MSHDDEPIDYRLDNIRFYWEMLQKKMSLEEEVREMRTGMSNRRSVTPTRFSSSIPELNLHLPTGATR